MKPSSVSTPPQDATALLPCPLCGETRIFLNAPNPHHHYGSINCPACMVVLPGAVRDQGELIRCWNDRSTPSASAGPQAEAWELQALRDRVVEFILETDPFGDHFSRREIGLIEAACMTATATNEPCKPARDDLKRCAICGFIVDPSFEATKPTIDFTMAGRTKTKYSGQTANVEKILHDHFYTGEPGQHEAIKSAAKLLTVASAGPQAEAVAWVIHWTDTGPQFTRNKADAERGIKCGAFVEPFAQADRPAVSAETAKLWPDPRQPDWPQQQPDGRGAVIDALDNSQSLLAMIHQLNTNGSVSEHDWETEGLSDLITKQIKENRAALQQSPATDGPAK